MKKLVGCLVESPIHMEIRNKMMSLQSIYRYLGSTFRSTGRKRKCAFFASQSLCRVNTSSLQKAPPINKLIQRESSFLLGKLGAQPLRFTDAGRWQTRQPQRVRNMSLHQESSCSCEAMLLVVLQFAESRILH